MSTSSFLYSLCSYDCFFGFLHLLLCFFLHFLLCTPLGHNLIQILISPCHSRLLGPRGRPGLVLAPRQTFFFSFCSRRHSRRSSSRCTCSCVSSSPLVNKKVGKNWSRWNLLQLGRKSSQCRRLAAGLPRPRRGRHKREARQEKPEENNRVRT